MVRTSLNGNNGSYTNTDDVKKDRDAVANRRKQPHRRDPGIGKHGSKNVAPPPVEAPEAKPEPKKLLPTERAKFWGYVDEDGRFMSREKYRDHYLDVWAAIVFLRRFFRRAVRVTALVRLRKAVPEHLEVAAKFSLRLAYMRAKRKDWEAYVKVLLLKMTRSQWQMIIVRWWRSVNWVCRLTEYESVKRAMPRKTWYDHVKELHLHRKATKWKFFSSWFIRQMSKYIVVDGRGVSFSGVVAPSLKHLKRMDRVNQLDWTLRGHQGDVRPLSLGSMYLDLKVPRVYTESFSFDPSDYHQMYYVYVRSKAVFIGKFCSRWFKRTHTRLQLPVKEDWPFSWQRLFWTVCFIVFVLLCVYVKKEDLVMALGSEGLVVAWALGLIVLWIFAYNKYAHAFNFRITFFDSNIRYSRYFNQSAIDWSYRRTDKFEGSGYNQVETLFVYRPYYIRMINGLSSHRASMKNKQNAKDLIISDLSEWLLSPIPTDSKSQSHEVYMRMIHEYWLTRASSACARYKELEDAHESHRVSDKTGNGVDDLVFRQKDSSGASGLVVSHVAGVLNRKN